MRASLSVLVVLATALPAAAQPALTPPIAGEPYALTVRPRRAPVDVYVTESFGGVNIKSEQGSSGGLRVRGALGLRRKNIAVELWIGAAIGFASHDDHYSENAGYLSLDTDPTPPSGGDHHHGPTTGLAMWGVDVKYLKSVSRNFEVYARGGLSRGFTDGGRSGRGLGIGAGAQLKGKVPALGLLFWPLFFTGWGPKITAAIYVETGYEFYRLHGDSGSSDAQLTHMTFGFAFGSDF